MQEQTGLCSHYTHGYCMGKSQWMVLMKRRLKTTLVLPSTTYGVFLATLHLHSGI